MKTKHITASAFFNLRALIATLLCAAAFSIITGTLLAFLRAEPQSNPSQRTLMFAERVAYQRAIEEVYWRHRIWPKENANPKPPLDAVMSQTQMENEVADYLRNSQALEDYWQRLISAEQLQAEMDRMAKHTRQPEVLQELFQALDNNPFVISECLARPALAERLTTDLSAQGKIARFESARIKGQHSIPITTALRNSAYILPAISGGDPPCVDDTWTATSTTNAPDARQAHTAVWTGSEMIVWGGNHFVFPYYFNTGGRYDPSADSWTATTTNNAPPARNGHTAVWSGSEMIVWGGNDDSGRFNTGGRYNPSTDTWTATNPNAPQGRDLATAVWTGSEMIVWGGEDFVGTFFNTGGKYDPGTDSWLPTSTINAPAGRSYHTAVWTGSEMIVWGGTNITLLETGGRYNPSSDTWTETNTIGAADARLYHTAVWISSEMIVWGGYASGADSNTGGRYNPGTNSWIATSLTNAPAGRSYHTAVWTGNEMIVWGGRNNFINLNTGGRYCAVPAPTPRVTPTPRAAPTPRPRPTPAPHP